MPASPSSRTDPAIGHLVQQAADPAGGQPGLLEVLARVADPRHRRGVRYQLAVILGLALCAVVAGARSFTAIAEWAADADEQTLHGLGVTGRVPSESTFRRTLQRLDADTFDDLAGSWAAQRTAPGPKQRRVIAVDGKTLRGSAGGGEPGEHLLAALDHGHGVVLGQVEAGAKTNEIPMFPVLMDRINITGAVITADAMHAQRSHATYLAGRDADYLFTVTSLTATRASRSRTPSIRGSSPVSDSAKMFLTACSLPGRIRANISVRDMTTPSMDEFPYARRRCYSPRYGSARTGTDSRI